MKLFSLTVMLGLLIGSIGCSRPLPRLGVDDGRLKACPDSPNCVSSQADDNAHYIAPLTYSGSRQEARSRLTEILQQARRTELVVQQPHYIRATVKSAFFRFADDLEFFFPEDGIIHLRSAARTGYWDLGVNRRRMESIRREFSRQP